MNFLKWISDLINQYLKSSKKPVVVPPVIVSPAEKSAEVATNGTCGCDLTVPLCDPPWTDAELKAAGNAQECPVYGGRDIRWAVYYPTCRETHLVAKPFKNRVEYRKNDFKVSHAPVDGYQYHITGYSHNHRGNAPDFPVPVDGYIPYKTTTFVYAECRKV